jgi:hypothetical protein
VLISGVGMQGGLMVDFENDGGHSVLLMKVGSLPTLTDADFTFRSKELVKGEQVWKLPAFYKRGRNL